MLHYEILCLKNHNMATVRIFRFKSDKFQADRICTPFFIKAINTSNNNKSGNAPDLYSEGAQFESRPGYQLS
jgi:hypothetical protein